MNDRICRLDEYAAAAGVWISVVALDADALTRCWCVDVHAVADVDADVVSAAAPEYEVARLQSHEGNWCNNGLLFVGGAWQADAVFSENILDQTAAVETAWAGAAPYIWIANKLSSIIYNRRS